LSLKWEIAGEIRIPRVILIEAREEFPGLMSFTLDSKQIHLSRLDALKDVEVLNRAALPRREQRFSI
jgi:hypothetical protein